MRKVAYAHFYWKNQEDCIKDHKPTVPTVRGCSFDEDMIELAIARGILDVWTPYITLQFTMTKTLHFQGNKALDLWKAWNAHIFSKQNSKKKDKTE